MLQKTLGSPLHHELYADDAYDDEIFWADLPTTKRTEWMDRTSMSKVVRALTSSIEDEAWLLHF